MDKTNLDSVNVCYEALLDLKSIFPAWSDLQNNFSYHWRQILTSSSNFKESDNKILKTYLSILEPMINNKEEGLESNKALELVRKLDNYRKNYDEEFESYVLEEVLNKDAPSIVPPRRAPKAPVVKRKAPAAPKIVVNEETTASHGYGTRRSKMLLESDGDSSARSNSSMFGMGEHLKKGIFSDYIWEFTGGELKDEFDD